MTHHILIVDDDVTLLRCIADHLEEQSFEVTKMNNGAEALRAAYRDHPDLVLLDLEIPGMDGWTLIHRLREMSDMPIIILTAISSESDKLRGFSQGVDDYITKPFSFAELTARILAVLNRAKTRREIRMGTIHLGDIVLDFKKREARRGEEVISLTPTEYKMLEALSRQGGDPVEENELIKEVWGDYRQEETAAARRYIWMLRQKFEEDPSKPKLILTVRGFGYRLEMENLVEPG